jgi:hypothetical protein
MSPSDLSVGARLRSNDWIALDASFAVDWRLQTSAGQRIEQRIYLHNESLHWLAILHAAASDLTSVKFSTSAPEGVRATGPRYYGTKPRNPLGSRD